MELNDALRIPLAPSDVWDALQDLALLRASLDNCESFTRLGHGEFALTMTVPLGPLRARYDARAHVAGQDSGPAEAQRRTINFKARAEGIGALRGQIEVKLRADDASHGIGRERGTLIEYTIWATSSGPLAELPTRQLEHALHQLADDFFDEFGAVVRAKHGQGPNRARGSAARRQHVFLRPIALSGIARRTRMDHGHTLTGRAASASHGGSHGVSHGVSHQDSGPHAMPNWAWAAMIFLVALLLYVARWFSEH
ncbi:carbon monoxide dehydrogenase [Paraburkholderia fungorum]|jgi:carbon monoxide dehydrogenase subunit G|uniref:CoxG family protein n=1 Tax=Paraburkholderia fungorum TaxID=134537 RepID=UPI00047F2B89|nr:SRPBCC domain-containing protein [Paraburkholderia fungorum]MBB5542345.1 carbon monoxide dehydrogenase subunit G [Paraburkholderia fungorum]PNE57610.1 carbon monoxide dehydrogenase [Paraburkholderia fungorum]